MSSAVIKVETSPTNTFVKSLMCPTSCCYQHIIQCE